MQMSYRLSLKAINKAAAMKPKKVLIIEDDENIAELLQLHLCEEGYEISHAAEGVGGLAMVRQGGWDALILDLMLPGIDGLEICRHARTMASYMPIVIISARSSEVHRVLVLELGADDYISKPFGIHELRARIKTIARRCLSHNAPQPNLCFPFGDLTVFPNELCAKRGEQKLELTLREVRILSCLYSNKNQVVTRDMLFDAAWGYDYFPNSRTLDQHISRLRKVIELDSSHPQLIRTVHGIGYRYQVQT